MWKGPKEAEQEQPKVEAEYQGVVGESVEWKKSYIIEKWQTHQERQKILE